MSQPSTSKGKDNTGKKYASLNVNQTYRGTKVENRSAAGQTRHGLQSLGKVAQNRRLPPPANLPSLKKENLGNDPNVNLVPSGSSGWGKKEKSTVAKPEEQIQQPQQKQPKPEPVPEISLRPNAGVALKNQSDQGKGWSNMQTTTGSAPQPPANSFQREFPRLGGDSGGQSAQESVKEQESDERGLAGENANMPSRPMNPMRPGGPRMDFNFQMDQQRPMFNGAPPMQAPGSHFYPSFPAGMVPPYMMMQPMYPYAYPQNRMAPPGAMGQPSRQPTTKADDTDRPATVKQADIQKMDDELDDGGWAGAQEEVDYTAKLKFDESDEEQELPENKAGAEKSRVGGSHSEDRSTDQSTKESNDNRPSDGRGEAWAEHPPGYQGQMQFRPPWLRAPFPSHFDPTRGPPPQGYAYPPPWMYPVPGNYRMPGMPQQRPQDSGAGPQPPVSGPPVGVHPGSSSPKPSVSDKSDIKDPDKQATDRRKNHDDVDREEAERRAKAAAKLHALEAKIKRREETARRDSESSSKSGARERYNSENSDSSKGAAQFSHNDTYTKPTRETPPRFLKQQTQAKAGKSDATTPTNVDGAGSYSETGPVPRIMKRRDSLRSDDASSVHSQDSWVHAATNEKGTSKVDPYEEPPVADRSEEANYQKKTRDHSKVLSKDRNKEEKVATKKHHAATGTYSQQNKVATYEGGKFAKEDYRDSRNVKNRVSSDEITHQQDRKQEKNRAESKSESKKYGYRQDKGNYKDQKLDSLQEKKDPEFDSRNNQKEDKRYHGREQRTDESKFEERRDGEQGFKPDQEESNDDVYLERKDSRDRGGQQTFESATSKSQRQTEGERKNRDKSYEKAESEDYKAKSSQTRTKPMSDNFKRLEKPKSKHVSMKLSASKQDVKDKAADKTQQKEASESKRPSAWSRVVSGETDDAAAVPSGTKNESQPKKSLREIQEEEEKKETERHASIEKEQQKVKPEDIEKRVYDPNIHRPLKPVHDRRDDESSRRRGYDERQDERYYDVRNGAGGRRGEYNRGRRSEDRFENRGADRTDSKATERPEHKSHYAARNERGGSNRNVHDDNRRSFDDRKRKHEETEKTDDALVRNDQDYSDYDNGDLSKGRSYEGRRKDFPDRQTDRGRFSDRGRGNRGGRGSSSYARGRGRGTYSNPSIRNQDGSYLSKVTQNAGSEILPEKSQSSQVSEVNETTASDDIKFQSNESEAKEEIRDFGKGKENKGPERKGFGVPPKRSDDRHRDSTKNRDKQGYVEYSSNRGNRNEHGRQSRSYSSGNATKTSLRHNSTHDNQPTEESVRSERNISTDNRGDRQRPRKKTSLEHTTPQQEDDSDFEDVSDNTDDEGVNSDKKETANADDSKEKTERSRSFKTYGQGQGQSRGFPRGQTSNRGNGQRNSYDDRRYDGGYNTDKVPPRFQKQKEVFPDMRRGLSHRARGSRSRGKYQDYGTRVRGSNKSGSSNLSTQQSGSKIDESKDNDLSGDSDDDTFHSADDFVNSEDEKNVSKDVKHGKDHDSSKRYSNRGKYPPRGARGRGGRVGRSGNSNSFLADRQQERVSHIDTSGWAVTLPAAGKVSFAGSKTAEGKSGSKLFNSSTAKRNGAVHGTEVEALSEFCEPPKKMAKSKFTEKVDILRQYDVNNIASVVCIDDIPQHTENMDTRTQTEDDGFVQVTSRKAQKELREKQKEEEKRKLQEELSSKTVKKSSGDTKEAINRSGKASRFADQSQRITQGFSQSSGPVAVQSLTQIQTSNAAMAAVGGWEPAQALMRGVQSVTPVDNLESGKSAAVPAPPPAMNAWKRPLNFASSLASTPTTNSNSMQPSMPDPKAVGTGKPNSSPAKQVPSMQPAQSGGGIISNGLTSVYNELVPDDTKFQPITTENAELSSEIESKAPGRKPSLTRKTEQRKINKVTKRETAPRFQNMAKSKTISGTRLANGDSSRPKKKESATVEDIAVTGFRTLHGEDRAPGKRPDSSKLRRCNSESCKEEPVSGLPPAEHNEQPAISFIQEDHQSAPRIMDNHAKEKAQSRKDDMRKEQLEQVNRRSKEEENAKDTARSMIKSLGDDDEKNLETRSLPSSTPPLVVEIHAPRTNGPSSDPGKANSMPTSNYLTQEVDEMSMKVLSAKKIWDSVPASASQKNSASSSKNNRTAWSEQDKSIVTSTSVTSVASVSSGDLEASKVTDSVAPTPVAVVAAQSIKSTEDDAVTVAATENAFISTKTVMEQQNNVCKVKPQQKQQQQAHLEEKQLITSLTSSQLFPSQFAFQQSYALPVHSSASHSKIQQQPYMLSLDRQITDNTSNSMLYSHRETAHRDLPGQHPQPQVPLNIHQVSQVRPTSPMSHQIQDTHQTSMMVSNIYGTPAIQGTQQNQVLWPISRHTLQPSTSLSYLSQQQNHERTPDILNSSPLYMTFDQGNNSVLSAQRYNTQMQQTPALGLVLPQQTMRSGSMLSVIQPSQSSKDNPAFSMSPSPSPFHHIADLQLGGHSDLTKHVNAKPFQPSSKTPPGAQIINHQQPHMMNQQQTKFVNQFSKLVGPSLNLQQHMSEQHHTGNPQSDRQHTIQQQQAMHHHSLQQQSQVLTVQPHGALTHSAQSHSSLSLQQHVSQPGSGQQHFMQHHSFQGPHVAAVGPRSAQNRAVSSVSPSVQSQKRIATLSPVDASLQFIHGPTSSGNNATQAHQHGSLMQQGNQTANIVQVLHPTQNLPSHSPQNRPFIVRPSVHAFAAYPSRAVPGPIQRPPRPSDVIPATTSNRPKQPVLPIVKSVEVSSANKSNTQMTSSGSGNNFRSEEHQKMIEETRRYFASQSKAEPTANAAVVPVANPVTPTTTAAQVILARPSEKTVEKKASIAEDAVDAPDIPAAAMLNDPSDIDSIIKSRPSLAKAFRGNGKPEKGSRSSVEKNHPKKSQDKEEKPKKGNIVRNSSVASKTEQKTGVGKPLPQKSSDRAKKAYKANPESSRGKH